MSLSHASYCSLRVDLPFNTQRQRIMMLLALNVIDNTVYQRLRRLQCSVAFSFIRKENGFIGLIFLLHVAAVSQFFMFLLAIWLNLNKVMFHLMKQMGPDRFFFYPVIDFDLQSLHKRPVVFISMEWAFTGCNLVLKKNPAQRFNAYFVIGLHNIL